ncbi:MAG TPA: 4-demethylwyosine synthase TYW1 [Candidatus Nanoarchaeia archaeon]|nr:4-demethylwyosine synthase TYW1 [Candidatus Nanoarchaeia archaeon]
MIVESKKENLYQQGYRIVGKHSAVKPCLWCKKSLLDSGHCYKEEFYDTLSHRCVQMTPALGFCGHRCVWCWRDIEFTLPKWKGKEDDPSEIVDECIAANAKYLQGFGGNDKTNRKKFGELSNPQQFAISLSGEPTMYPKLPELILELRKRKINQFLVTNGTNPSMIKKLIAAQPTQIYITLPAPDEETYLKVCKPLIKNGWAKILKSLSLLSKFKRSVVRLTLVKGVNMKCPEQYGALVKKYRPKYIEVKAYMHVGYSQKRLKIENMPLHSEIAEFAAQIALASGYKIKDEKKDSRVVLLSR